MEVEFPPLPQSVMEDTSSSAYTIIDANLRLAIELAKLFAVGGTSVAITLPDRVEYERSVRQIGTDAPFPRVQFHPMIDMQSAVGEETSLDGIFSRLFTRKGAVTAAEGADIHLILGASCQELPDVEKLSQQTDGAVVLFNLNLDTLRGDLGLPAFPGKDLHWRFLARAVPVFYMRQRSYTLSLPKPPFLISYRGLIYRVYPELYQSLLDTGGKKGYKRVGQHDERLALGEFKELLTASLQIDDNYKSGPLAAARVGFKSKTWWEENADGKEESKGWRS